MMLLVDVNEVETSEDQGDGYDRGTRRTSRTSFHPGCRLGGMAREQRFASEDLPYWERRNSTKQELRDE